MSDVKTLRLANAAVDEAALEQFLRYQDALIEALTQRRGSDWAGAFAFAHASALQRSGLTDGVEHRLRALVADFAGRRSAAHEVRAKLSAASTLTAAQRAWAEREAARLDDLADFVARYGEGTAALLQKHEARVVELHQRLARLEGTGHLHPLGPAS